MKRKIPRRYRYKKKNDTNDAYMKNQARRIVAAAYGVPEKYLIDVEKRMSMAWRYTVTGRPYLEVVDDKRATL